jgi:selenide,water dikinase
MNPAELDKALSQITPLIDPKLLVGYDRADDAAVYQISDDTAVVQTLDFFTPVVDDPYTFGRIAATNSLSDVYAMGAKPIMALNIASFPNNLPTEILGDILRGGADTARDANIPIAGGHTIEGPEPFYGLSVTGIVHPKRMWTNAGAKPGDALILTKPLGSGVITTALRADRITPEQGNDIIQVMMQLNKTAADVIEQYHVNACTDITGYGLLGHASEIAWASGVGWNIYAGKIPWVEPALEMAKQGAVPGGSQVNRLHFGESMEIPTGFPEELIWILFDAQTSGGLLISVESDEAEQLITALKTAGVTAAAQIGEMRHDQQRVLLP